MRTDGDAGMKLRWVAGGFDAAATAMDRRTIHNVSSG